MPYFDPKTNEWIDDTEYIRDEDGRVSGIIVRDDSWKISPPMSQLIGRECGPKSDCDSKIRNSE